MDKLKLDKLKNLTKGRERQISGAVDKAGDFVDQKTKGKYADHIGKVENQVDKALGINDPNPATPPSAAAKPATPPPSTPPA